LTAWCIECAFLRNACVLAKLSSGGNPNLADPPRPPPGDPPGDGCFGSVSGVFTGCSGGVPEGGDEGGGVV
jgi:hypothetical protein